MADPRPAAGAARDSHPGLAGVAAAYQRFEPGAYLRNNYTPPRGDLSVADGVGPWKLRCLAQTFATGAGPPPGTGSPQAAEGRAEAGAHPGAGSSERKIEEGEGDRRGTHPGTGGGRAGGCSELRGEVCGTGQGEGGTEE